VGVVAPPPNGTPLLGLPDSLPRRRMPVPAPDAVAETTPVDGASFASIVIDLDFPRRIIIVGVASSRSPSVPSGVGDRDRFGFSRDGAPLVMLTGELTLPVIATGFAFPTPVPLPSSTYLAGESMLNL
jgi:hypothetical protein